MEGVGEGQPGVEDACGRCNGEGVYLMACVVYANCHSRLMSVLVRVCCAKGLVYVPWVCYRPRRSEADVFACVFVTAVVYVSLAVVAPVMAE